MKVQYTAPMVDERSFTTEDFSRHGIDQEGFAFNAENDFTADISEEAFVFLRDSGEAVLSEDDLPDPEEPSEDPDAEPDAQPSFDPADHSVDEVLTYLDANQNNPDEVQRILAAEAEGKNRKGLTNLQVPEA